MLTNGPWWTVHVAFSPRRYVDAHFLLACCSTAQSPDNGNTL
jgi:hypothetical protein